MTLQELNDTVQYLLIGLGMFVIATYLVFVMFGAFNESRKTHNTQKDINKYLAKHLIVYPLAVIAIIGFFLLALYISVLLQTWFIVNAANITVIDMNLLYLLSIPLGASIAYFLSPRTIEDYYDHDYTKYEQSIALMASNLLCLMVVTYYNTPVFVAILVYVGIYYITRKALHS